MDERTRVVFFHIGGDVFGGGSKMLLRLVTSLDRSRFDPVLLAQTDDELCKRARAEGVHVEIVPFRGALDTYNKGLLTTSPTTLLATGLRIAQFNADAVSHFRRAEVIWCKNLRAVLTLLPYVLATRTPVIWNIGLGLESDGPVTSMNELALRAVDHVFIESDDQARTVFTEGQYRRYHEKFTTFHKGIDLETFDPDSVGSTIDTDGGLRVGTAASLTPRKGIEHLIEAIPRVLDTHEDVMFYVAGEAPDGHEEYARELRQGVAALGVEDHVRFLGWVENMPGYLGGLDVFVLPSLNEGIPGAIREALAMEVPVIATDVGGTSDVVGEMTGRLVPPEDADAIACAISDLLSDPDRRAEMGACGRDLITTEFSMENYVDRYESFLSSLAEFPEGQTTRG